MNLIDTAPPLLTNRSFPPPALAVPPQPRFRSGDLVVLTHGQPFIGVVLEEQPWGLLRLSQAACPEIRLTVAESDVQRLSAWLLSAS